METHVCDKKPFEKRGMRNLLKGRRRQTDEFTCGGCSKTFHTICVLHVHCMSHTDGGSYYFDHVTKTAFPKHDLICSYTQVTEDQLEDIHNRDMIGLGKIMTSQARDINQEPLLMEEDKKQESDIEANLSGSERPEKHDQHHDHEASLDNSVNEHEYNKNNGSSENSCCANALDRERDLNSNNATCNEAGETVADEGNKWEDCLVTVKNVEKTTDGMFTFEMDKKDVHMFDETASLILEKINSEGESWIGSGGEFQIRVPIKADKMSTNDDITDTGINEEAGNDQSKGVGNRLESNKNNDDTWNEDEEKLDNAKRPNRPRGRPPKKHWVRNKKHESMKVSATNNEVKVNEYVESEQEINRSERRSGRKRKVSSRLIDSEWETPKQMRQNQLSPDEQTESHQKPVTGRNALKKMGRLDNGLVEIAEEIELMQKGFDELPTEITENESVQTSECKVHIAETGTKTEGISDVNAEDTCSADLSASEVLLSLSKGSKDTAKNEDIKSEHKTKKHKQKVKKLYKPTGKVNFIVKTSNDDNIENDSTKICRRGMPQSMRKDYTCKTCGKVGNLTMIKYHNQSHSNEKAFTCESCGKSFKTRACLMAHVRQHGEWNFKCHQCPASFYRKQYLTSHMLTHTGELPHVCPTCNKGFRELYILNRHINNVHKNIRKFACDICNMAFFRPQTRDMHRVRHFEPTMKCQYCTKMFKADLDRRKHELTHTGEKQFFCPKCSTGFSQLWPYYRHMWKKHNIGKDEAKQIKIRNKNIVSMRNINKQEVVECVQEHDEPEDRLDEPGLGYTVIENMVGNVKTDVDDNPEAINIIFEDKISSDVMDAQFKDGQIIIQQSDGLVTQTGEAMIVQSGEEMVIQSTSQVRDLKGIYDHLYVTDAANVASTIQVLSGNQQLEEGTVIMETQEEHPGSTDVSIVQQNIVILSDYSGIAESYPEIDGYTKEYSTLDI